MANHDVTVDMENNEEKRAKLQHKKSSTKWPTMKKNYPMWKKIFTISCAFGVVLDPLFFYIPVVNQDMKCIKLDKELKITTFLLRSITDLAYIVDIIFQFCTKHEADTLLAKAKRISWSHILINILAILPFPQAVIVFLCFSKIRSSRYLKIWKILNSFVIFQYGPRVLRIKLLRNKLDMKIGLWVQVAFSLFPVILASHVLGALWYFMAIQREMDCWQYVCRSENGCEFNSLNCDDRNFTSITQYLNDMCPINPPNTTLFNFGIYLNALQLGMNTTGSTNFLQKLLYCIWWGLQNLSSLGQNLQTSMHAWENLFAVFIFLAGMMLFVFYVNDVMQIRNRIETERSKKLLARMMKKKDQEIQNWLSEHDLPKDKKSVIMQHIKHKDNKDIHVKNILSILPSAHASEIKCSLCLDTLKKVPKLQNLNEQLLKAICEKLRPAIYTGNSYVIRKGKPLKMLIVIQGFVGTYTSITTENRSCTLGKGDFYGEELLTWALTTFTPSSSPMSPEVVKALTEVEAFVLMPDDLKSVFFKKWWHFKKEIITTNSDQLGFGILKNLAASSIGRAWRRHAKIRLNRRTTISG